VKHNLTLLLLFTCSVCFAQKEAAIWYFGSYAGLDFNCNPPVPIRSGMYYTQEGCAAASDANGNILFYTNGDSVYNRNHEVMPNGFGIGVDVSCWGSTTQGALIIPLPESDSIFYIFTIDCADDDSTLPNSFRYSIVDLSLNDGLGDVVLKYQHIKTPVTEKLAAIQHANGKDFWVVSHEHGTDAFNTYLVDATGFNPEPVVSNVGHIQWLPTFPEAMTRGYMKFSPDGKNLVVLSVSDQHTYCLSPQLFHFNDTTGVITLNYTIDDPDSINYYGATFSPDNNLLYFSGGWYGQYVHQFDANAGSSEAFLASKQEIFSPTTYYPSALQLGPDGKIYIATNMWWIDVIANPNAYGDACNYQSQQIWLNDCPTLTFSLFGLPNFPESYFRSTFAGSNCTDDLTAQYAYTGTCLGTPTTFNDNSIIYPDTINSWFWNFGDPASGAENVSNIENPTHLFTAPGTYTVTLIVATDYGIICKSDTISKEIYIDVCSDIDEATIEPQIAIVYPNPFSEYVAITPITNQPLTVIIYDFLGRIILEQTCVNTTTINTTQFADGVYWYELHDNAGIVDKGKLIKH
jgi:hypothetical protein